MKLDQLRYFLETAKHEHVGKASKALHVSASTVSHAISNLEDELGRELFVRQGRRIFLSRHGKLLEEKATDLLLEAEKIFNEVKSEKIEVQGHYRIAGTHLFCETFLTPAWNEIQSTHPKVVGEIFTQRSAQVLEKVVASEVDLGVCLSPQSHPKVESECLLEDELIIVVRIGHPLLKLKGVQKVKSISSFPTVLPKAFQGIESCESHPELKRLEIDSEVKLMYDSYSTAIEAVKNTDMWTLLPKLLLKTYSKDLQGLVIRGWKAPYNVSAIWPKSRVLTQFLENYKEIIRKHLETKCHS